MKSIRRGFCVGLLLALCLLLSGCKKNIDVSSSEPDEFLPSQPENSGEESAPSVEQDPLKALLRCIQVTEEADSFSASTEGTCSTQVLFFSYNQQIRSERTVTADAMFSQSVSLSSLVRVGVQQYFQGNTILVRSGEVSSMDDVVWAEEPTSVTQKAYRAAYGNTPRTFSNYRIDGETVLSVRLDPSSDGELTVVCELDPATSATEYAKQVMTMGGLNELPVFHSVTLTVTMDNSFRPLRVHYQETYDISIDLLGNTTCKADYTETFFSFDAVTSVPEQAFFEPFLQLPSAAYPEISSGYSLLLSLLGNSASYDLTLEIAGQRYPLQLSLDAASGAILLRGETADFLYEKDRYYFLSGETRVFADAEAFNGQFLPLTELFSQMDTSGQGGESSSFLSDFDIRTENGNLLLQAGDEETFFRTAIDLRTLSLLSAEARFSDSYLLLEKTSESVSFPSLSGCADLTPSLSAFSFLDALPSLRDGESLSGRLEVDGATAYTAKLTLALRDEIAFSLLPVSDALPISVYGHGQSLTAVWEELSLTGGYEDVSALLALFSDTRGVRLGAPSSRSLPRLAAEPGKLSLRFDDGSVLTFAGSEIQFSGGDFTVRLSGIGTTERKVSSAPKTAQNLSLSKLLSFLSASVYPELLRANAVTGDLRLTRGGEETHFRLRARLADSPAVGLTTDWNGSKTDLLYTDGTLFLSHPLIDAFLPIDRLSVLLEQLGVLSGGVPSVPSTETLSSALTAISCDGNRLILCFGDITVTMEKERLTVSYEDLEATAYGLFPANGTEIFSPLDRQNDVDLLSLAEKLASLAAQRNFSFSGNYTDGDIAVTLSLLEFSLNSAGEVSAAGVEFLLNHTNTPCRLLYDDGCLFLDAGETRLFCLAEALFSDGDLPILTDATGNTGEWFSGLKKITFRDDILTVETADARLSVSWSGDVLSQITYVSGGRILTLRSASFSPIPTPQLDLYTDVTPITGLLQALGATAEAGSFTFDGEIDLQAYSLTLRGIRASGTFRLAEQGLEGTLAFDVPYLPGLTSDGVPLMREDQLLTSCVLRSELFLTGGKLYMRRSVNASYGILRPLTYTATETGYLTLEEVLADPMRALSFLLRLESDTASGSIGGNTMLRETKVGGLLKRASRNGNLYTVEFDPRSFLPEADSLVFTARTDGTYLTGVEASVTFSPLSIILCGTLSSHGIADPSPALQQNFSEYNHLN